MIKYKIFLIITLALGTITQGQSNLSGTVIYKAFHDKTLITEENNKSNTNKGIEGANELLKNASEVYATLSFNHKESSYRVNEKLKIDGIESINITYFFAGGSNLFYHNKDSLNVIQSNTSLGKTFLIKSKAPNWVITKETKKIGDLLCIKAYTVIHNKDNDDVKGKDKIGATAWFCPAISIGYGPMQYFGLPGLIIELQFSKMTFIVEKINLKKKNVIIEKHKEAPIITVEEFNTIARKKAPSFFEN